MVTTLAGYKPLFSKGAIAHHYLRLTGMFIGGFILFELVILGAGFLSENQSVLTVPILWSIFISNALWLVPSPLPMLAWFGIGYAQDITVASPPQPLR